MNENAADIPFTMAKFRQMYEWPVFISEMNHFTEKATINGIPWYSSGSYLCAHSFPSLQKPPRANFSSHMWSRSKSS